jgi:hypothetical protein
MELCLHSLVLRHWDNVTFIQIVAEQSVSSYGSEDRFRFPAEAGVEFMFASPSLCPDRLWGPINFLCNEHRELFTGDKGKTVKLNNRFH